MRPSTLPYICHKSRKKAPTPQKGVLEREGVQVSIALMAVFQNRAAQCRPQNIIIPIMGTLQKCTHNFGKPPGGVGNPQALSAQEHGVPRLALEGLGVRD